MRYPDIVERLRAVEAEAGILAAKGEERLLPDGVGGWTTAAAVAGDAAHEIIHLRRALEAIAEEAAKLGSLEWVNVKRIHDLATRGKE